MLILVIAALHLSVVHLEMMQGVNYLINYLSDCLNPHNYFKRLITIFNVGSVLNTAFIECDYVLMNISKS